MEAHSRWESGSPGYRTVGSVDAGIHGDDASSPGFLKTLANREPTYGPGAEDTSVSTGSRNLGSTGTEQIGWRPTNPSLIDSGSGWALAGWVGRLGSRLLETQGSI